MTDTTPPDIGEYLRSARGLYSRPAVIKMLSAHGYSCSPQFLDAVEKGDSHPPVPMLDAFASVEGFALDARELLRIAAVSRATS